MTEPMITCPKCQTEIKLTESLASPIIESARREYEQRLAQKYKKCFTLLKEMYMFFRKLFSSSKQGKRKTTPYEFGQGIYCGCVGSRLDKFVKCLYKLKDFQTYPEGDQNALKIELIIYIAVTFLMGTQNLDEKVQKEIFLGFCDEFYDHFKQSGIAKDKQAFRELINKRFKEYSTFFSLDAIHNIDSLSESYFKNALGINQKDLAALIYMFGILVHIAEASTGLAKDLLDKDFEIICQKGSASG